jgi:hypothetical protein
MTTELLGTRGIMADALIVRRSTKEWHTNPRAFALTAAKGFAKSNRYFIE